MKAVVTRVNSASVSIDGSVCGRIGKGFLILLGVAPEDTPEKCRKLAEKILGLRVFRDENDKMNRSLEDIKGDMLIVSNITLSADMKHGRRPDFSRSASPSEALRLYNYFVEQVKNQPIGKVCTGEFGAHMHVSVENDGPVNIIIDTERIGK